MTEQTSAKLQVNDQTPIATSELRDSAVFQMADPTSEVPDVVLRSGTPNPLDRPHRNMQRVGIDVDGEEVGAFNLTQALNHSWINDVEIKRERRGEKLAVSAYLGMICALHEVNRPVRSDPAGLSEDSVRVWESLQRRGVAQATGEQDQHGNSRFISVI